MTEHPIRWHARDTDSEAVRARLAELNDATYPQERADAITARIDAKRVSARMRSIIHENRSMRARVLAIWELADYIGSQTTDKVACTRGCSHCCNIAVSLPKDEAALIGARIGRIPMATKPRLNADHIDWGYHNPCPFLRDGECSIYESRPLACRIHYSVDRDDLLCRLSPPYSTPVPYLNTSELTRLLMQVSSRGGMPHYADIREWFPPSKQFEDVKSPAVTTGSSGE
jgi:uncharacterized protein